MNLENFFLELRQDLDVSLLPSFAQDVLNPDENFKAMARSNNWRRMHSYPLRRKGMGRKKRMFVGEVSEAALDMCRRL